MTKDIAFYMCENKSPYEIAQAYKKFILVQIYVCLFGIEPRSRDTALDLAYHIWNFIQDEKRTADLCKLLR